MQGLLLFDIDGVIRDVSKSYRLAIKETVFHFIGWRPDSEDIDTLKAEGNWNNDWYLSFELISRHKEAKGLSKELPSEKELIDVFSDFYFGGNPDGETSQWNGFILNEPLLVEKAFFTELNLRGFSWGFLSGAEPPSAKFVLENRLGLKKPPLIAMGEAPEKPDPTGLIKLATKLAGKDLENETRPITYLGDTVADVLTVINAREENPKQRFISFGIAPPHLQKAEKRAARKAYEHKLKEAGADKILRSTNELLDHLHNL